jgi:hypothetical protein
MMYRKYMKKDEDISTGFVHIKVVIKRVIEKIRRRSGTGTNAEQSIPVQKKE